MQGIENSVDLRVDLARLLVAQVVDRHIAKLGVELAQETQYLASTLGTRRLVVTPSLLDKLVQNIV